MIHKLIVKDFKVSAKKHISNFILYIIIAGFIFQYLSEQAMYPYFCVLAIIVIIFHSIGFEMYKNGDVLSCSLPVKRTTVVISKYAYAFVIAAGGSVFFSLYAVTLNSVLPHPAFNLVQANKTAVIFVSVFVILFLISITLPLLFKFGVSLGYSLSFFIILLFLVVIPLINRNSALNGIQVIKKIARNSIASGLYPLLSFGLILLLVVSFFLSSKFYSKKEI